MKGAKKKKCEVNLKETTIRCVLIAPGGCLMASSKFGSMNKIYIVHAQSLRRIGLEWEILIAVSVLHSGVIIQFNEKLFIDSPSRRVSCGSEN